jgi:DNA-directed RNA polymerase specialized sigma24 family protein
MTTERSQIREEAGRQLESGIVREAVRRSRQGDMEAVRFLYTRYAPEVFACAWETVRDDGQAEEVMKGVFGDLVTQIADYEGGEEPFSSWLLDVARTAALAHADPLSA